jgi:hypothetical protein
VKSIKKSFSYLFVPVFVLSTSFITVYAQAFTEGRSIFGSNRPDYERLVPNCSIRNEYNPYMNQYTQNEICSPYLVAVPGPTGNNQNFYNQPQYYPQPREFNDLDFRYIIMKYYLSQERNIYQPNNYQPDNFYGYENENVYRQPSGAPTHIYEPDETNNFYGYQNENVYSEKDTSGYLNEDVYIQDEYAGYENENVADLDES